MKIKKVIVDNEKLQQEYKHLLTEFENQIEERMRKASQHSTHDLQTQDKTKSLQILNRYLTRKKSLI